MTQQYWVGDFFIDLSRNQITQNKQSQTLAPKALAVLTYLAEHQGKVISQDALLSSVWQNTVVSPNTLQRSIAQLRKALGDDGKVQVYIKTHAKQGYSLECDVKWHDNVSSADAAKPDHCPQNAVDDIQTNKISSHTAANVENKPAKPGLRLAFITGVIVLFGIIGFKYLTPKQASAFSIDDIRLLTTTDNKELASIYSPDGQYVVFHRFSEEFCVNNIWAKNSKTQQEFQLTQSFDSYGRHSFSKDGKKLVFITTAGCNEAITQKKCYKLMSLDFNQALESPQVPSVLVECKNSEIRNPHWLNNNNIALLQKFSDRWKLINYSTTENNSQVLYEVDEGNLIDFDYSASDDIIALIRTDKDGNNYIEMLKPDGQLVSSHRIEYPQEIAKFRYIYPNFSPFAQQLVFSTGRQLFTLSYDGQVTNISLPLDNPMGTPVFHPDGKRMLVIKGHYDSDIVSFPLTQITQPQVEQAAAGQTHNKHTSVLERSIFAEDNAMFQPHGELIAYQSARSGEDQLWLSDSKNARQLSHFPKDTYFAGIDWSTDGKSILVNANHQLSQIGVDGSEKTFAFEHRVERLFQWDNDKQTALVNIRINGLSKFAELDLANTGIRIINEKTVNWAVESSNGQLIYTDQMDRFWRLGPAEDQLINALNGQGNDKRFLIKDNVIYAINDRFQLWSYDLSTDKFQIIGAISNNIVQLTDINQSQLLMTTHVSSRKEVAELSLNE